MRINKKELAEGLYKLSEMIKRKHPVMAEKCKDSIETILLLDEDINFTNKYGLVPLFETLPRLVVFAIKEILKGNTLYDIAEKTPIHYKSNFDLKGEEYLNSIGYYFSRERKNKRRK